MAMSEAERKGAFADAHPKNIRYVRAHAPVSLLDAICQEVFEKAHAKRAQYRGDAGGVLAWEMVIAMREISDQLDKAAKHAQRYVPFPTGEDASIHASPTLIGPGRSPERAL